MTTPTDPHGWFRRRMPFFVGGLLVDDEEKRFLEHRAECNACREAFDEFTVSDEIAQTERGAHIPAPMLARWETARRELRGIERAMVRAHLERCAECRGDLERTGQRPELEFVTELEAAPSPGGLLRWLTGRLPSSGAARVAEPVGAARPRPARRWVPWALGGWATAATAAALLLVANPPPPAGESVEIGQGVGGGAPAPERVPPATLGLDLLPPVLTLRGALRSGSDQPPVLRIAAGVRFVHLALPELFLDDTTQVALRVTGPGGTAVIEQRRRYGDFSRGRTLLVGRPGVELEPGAYRLAVTVVGSAPPEQHGFDFTLAR